MLGINYQLKPLEPPSSSRADSVLKPKDIITHMGVEFAQMTPE